MSPPRVSTQTRIRDVRALIKKRGEDHAVLLSTHILPEVEASCTRAIVIARGKLVAEGSIDALRAKSREGGVRIIFGGTETTHWRLCGP